MYASDYKHLYASKTWKRMSSQFRKSHPVCMFCGKPTQVADHIRPHKGNTRLFFDLNNLIPLCKSCHDSEKAKIENGKVPGKDFVINNEAASNGLPESDNHPWNKK